MKRKNVLILTIILALGLFIGCDSASAPTHEQTELEMQVDAILTDSDFRGAALIVQDGEVILRTAYGMADDLQGIENTVYSPFHIASVTKNFTGAAILLLELDGKLDTSDTLDHFFTGSDGLENVTIAHLLAMQGGFYDYTAWVFSEAEVWEFEEALIYTVEDIEAYIIENYWSGMPRTRFAYCNTDYWLLGRIIEQVSGMSYEEFIASRLFEPAGMTASGFSGINESVLPHGFPAFYVDGENLMDPNNWPFFFAYSTGGLISTIDDLNLWLDAYFSGELFPEYLLDTIRVGSYNYGWIFAGDSIWHHSGSAAGFTSQIIYDRNSSTRIILLSNDVRGVTANLVRDVSDAVLDVPIEGFELPRER